MYAAALPPDDAATDLALDTAFDLVAGQLDAAFVGSGTALGKAYDLVETLIAKLAALNGALDVEGASRAIATMEGLASRIARLPRSIEARAGALGTIGTVNALVAAHIFTFDRTLEFLRVCAFNIKIAAAGEGGFSEFGDVMVAKLDVSGAEIRAIHRDVQKLLAVIPAVSSVDRTLAQKSEVVAADTPGELIDSAHGLRLYLDASVQRSATVATIARTIRSRLAEALGAMQIGDITRQRLEHVAQGLRLLAAECPDPLDPACRTPGTAHVLALLEAQVVQTAADFLRESARLADCQRAIGPELAALRDLREQDNGSGQGARFLQALEHKVDTVRTLTDDLRQADERSHAIAADMAAMVERLGERLAIIHRITAEVDNMAWNAEIRCDHMGQDGRALAPVASEIRKLVSRLKDTSAEVQSSVRQLNLAAQSLIEDGSGDPAGGQTLEGSLATIRDGARRIDEGLVGLDEDADGVAAILRKAVDSVAVIAGIAAPLDAAATLLASLAPTKSDEPGQLDDTTHALMAAIERLYTMASERSVHRPFAPPCADLDAHPLADDDLEEDDGLF